MLAAETFGSFESFDLSSAVDLEFFRDAFEWKLQNVVRTSCAADAAWQS